jgi:hypothetical protein
MKNLQIGYWPLTRSMDSAGDRRRLLFWAAARGHTITTDLTQRVDVIVASENSDFNSNIFLKSKAPLVFDLVDAYLSPLNSFNDYGRGVAKKVSRQISGGVKPFSQHISDFCERSSAVLCSSIEQEELVKRHNRNTHVILDSHDEFPFIRPKKPNKNTAPISRILWEGQPATIRGVREISSVLYSLAQSQNLEFNFVTDEKYFKFLNKYFQRDTLDLLKKDLSTVAHDIHLIPWTPENLLSSADNGCISMIPIDLTVPMQKLKPENRLLIMWRLGLPCLTSASPAYSRVAMKAGVNAVCHDQKAWAQNFQLLLDNPVFAYQEVVRGQEYLLENHNRRLLLKKWDAAIESVVK